MNRSRRVTLAAVAAVVGSCALAALVHATVVAGPNPLTFPEREAGSTSDPQTVTVTLVCTNFRPDLNPGAPCLSQDTFTKNPQFTGDNPSDFFADGGGTCPAQLGPLINAPAVQCTITVRFKPTTAGQRKALFSPGTGTPSSPAPIAVQGSATAKPNPPGQNATPGTKKGCKKGRGKKKGCKKKKK